MELKFNVFPRNQSPGFIICLASTRLKAGLNRAFQDAGYNVTTEQWTILSSLWERDGVHQSALAERTAKDRHNITRIIALLEKAALVRRERHHRDKRCQKVFLTKEGRNITQKLVPIAMDFLGYALAGLTQDDLDAMQRIFAQIMKNLSDGDEANVSNLACSQEIETSMTGRGKKHH